MIAILISAGQGLRMYPLTANTPKCLIDIGKGKTVLENQIDVLYESGIREIYIVAGYLIDQVKAKVDGYYLKGLKIKIIHNPFYATSNNIVSVWLASLAVNSECITINGDDLFKLSVINSLMSSKGDIVMATSIKKDYDSDDMLVFQENNQVYSVGKDLDKNKANGESAGIIKYTLLGLSILRETLDEMMKDSENHQKFYLLALQKIMNRGVPINSCNVDFNDWAEIDFHPDVKDVRSKVDFFVNKIHSE